MLKIKAPKDLKVYGELDIPASKSISNRCLIIKALCKEDIELENLSISDDTKVLQDALKIVENSKTREIQKINIGLAGTAFRFLTAYLATKKGSFILTGEQRIKERPIKPLVEALKLLGANIQYMEKDGFAPLLIKGKQLKSRPIEIDASVSSQFITALLLISPKIENGLNLSLKGRISSIPYINMTLNLMNYFGIQSSFEKNEIKIVNAQNYRAKNLFIEADWSSASYFYQALALAKNGKLKLLNYSQNSIQGDSETAKLFKNFGIETKFGKDSITLEKITLKTSFFEYDFSNEPDLAQTFVALCVGLEIEAKISGLESLKIKETNRINALNTEINKLNWELTETENGIYSLQKMNTKFKTKELIFKTYKDHRMAMCLTPLCLKYGEIQIENPEVVSKSNPLFWEHMKSLGFEIIE